MSAYRTSSPPPPCAHEWGLCWLAMPLPLFEWGCVKCGAPAGHLVAARCELLWLFGKEFKTREPRRR